MVGGGEDLGRLDAQRHLVDRLAEQAGDGRLDHRRRQFALQRQDFLADDLDALRLQFGFDQRLDFFDHHHLIGHGRQFAALLEGHRPREAELEHRRIGKDSFTCM
jgi:hypothetical protein